MKLKIKDITRLAIVAALYVALTYVSYPFAYGYMQFRISEILVLLCFFRKDYIYSLTIGCILANLLSPYGILDIIFGTLATLISVILIAYSKRLFLASLYPAIFNGLIIGTLIYYTTESPVSIFFYMGSVAFGEFIVVSIVGYIVFRYLIKKPKFLSIIEANQNVETNANF